MNILKIMRKNLNSMVDLIKLIDEDENYQLLYKWCSKEYIYLNFEQRKLSFPEIKEKYYKRTLGNSSINTFLIRYNKVKIGLIQYQCFNNEYGISKGIEIDIFIGEENYLHKGIGRKAINLLIDKLKNENHVFVMLPLKTNIKAINCYLKVGFKIEKELIMNDTVGNKQTYLLMNKIVE